MFSSPDTDSISLKSKEIVMKNYFSFVMVSILLFGAGYFTHSFVAGYLLRQQSQRKDVDWSQQFGSSNFVGQYSEGMTTEQSDDAIKILCTKAKKVHMPFNKESLGVGSVLFNRLKLFPKRALDRNHEIVADVTRTMLLSVFHQDRVMAQGFVYHNIDSDWGLGMAKNLIRTPHLYANNTDSLNFFLNMRAVADFNFDIDFEKSDGYNMFVQDVIDNSETIMSKMLPWRRIVVEIFLQQNQAISRDESNN